MKAKYLTITGGLLLAMASCQNEEIITLQESGQQFTLQAAYGTKTRTVVEQGADKYQTKWSAGDQIYVTDGNGLVTGVLTLVDGEGETSGTFSGVVSGNPAALRYAVFPVPANGMIDLNRVDASQVDAPMSAPISGNQANFVSESGLVRLLIYNLPADADIKLSANGIASTLEMNTQNGVSLSQATSADEIVIKNAPSGKEFFVPVCAGEQTVSTEFTLTVGKLTTKFTANIKKGAVSVNGIPEYYFTDDEIFEKKNSVVSTAEGLGNALEAATPGTTILLSNETADYGTITLGKLKDVTIVGNENSVVIFNTTADTKIENVKLEKVNFEYTGATDNCGVVINAEAQIDNLVLENCTFTGTGKKKGRGIYGQNINATIVLRKCKFIDLGYPVYTMSGGGYESLTVEYCTFENIQSWAIMPQYAQYAGDLTVTGCDFKNCVGGLVKAGAFTQGHTFTFTNNVITNSTEHPAKNWFAIDASVGTSIIEGNTKDGQPWTPSEKEGLK